MIKNFLKPFVQAETTFIRSKFIQKTPIVNVPVYKYSFFNKKGSDWMLFNKSDKDPKEPNTTNNEEPAEQRIDPKPTDEPKDFKNLKDQAEELFGKLNKNNEEVKKEYEDKEKQEEEEKPKEEQKSAKEAATESFEEWKEYFKKKSDGEDPKMPEFNWRYLALAGLATYFVADAIYETYSKTSTISYNEFIQNFLEPDRVKKIIIERVAEGSSYHTNAIIITHDEQRHALLLGNVDHFLENIERIQTERGKSSERFIPVEYGFAIDQSRLMERVINVVYIGLMFGVLWYTLRQVKTGLGSGKGQDIFNYNKSGVQIYGVDQKISARFKDVAGLDEAKVEITEFVDFLKKPKRFQELGAKIPRGALLAGPPGTGKTLLAKAAAGEAGVPFLYISGSDFVEMYVGVGASRVRDLFKKAKEHAPSIIFIDEIDAVGRKRESRIGGSDEKDNTLNQLLVEMDGFNTDTNVVVLAATNRKELLDNALTRPGRFDRSIDVQLPDIDGRKQIFMVHLKPLKIDPDKAMEDFAKRLATLTPGFSGADIANLCNEAAIMAARKNKRFVSTDEFESAAERVMAGLEKKKIISEEERRVVAVHESGHAVVSWFLEGGSPLLKLTIIPRSKGSLGFAQYLPNESSLETKEELMDRICTILGGRCSEELFNQKVTTGAYDDLRKAYDIAHAMITKFGMSEKIGFLGFSDEQYVKKVSEQTAKDIDDEIKAIIDECTVRTREVVRKYKTEIEKLSEALLEKETLDLNNIVKILGERPFPPKSNFKAYLEQRRDDEEADKNKKDDSNNNNDNDSGTGTARPQESTA